MTDDLPIASQVFKRYQALDKPRLAGLFEGAVRHAYELALAEGDHAIDVGAHRGLHTFPMARAVGASGRVYAIEAAAKMASHLAETIAETDEGALAERITLVRKAASDAPGTATFNFVPRAAGLSGLREQPYPEGAEVETETVTVDALDAMVEDHGRIGFIKLDVEGAEYHALRGARRILAESRPVFAMEFGNAGGARRYDYDGDDFFGLMDESGYDLFNALGSPFGRENWGKPTPWYLFGTPRGDAGNYHHIVQPAVMLSLLDGLGT